VNTRSCNRIAPSQINTTGLTHLYYAFARIDPGTFFVVPASNGDSSLYTQFTALKTSKLQTWIAIGGFDFSNVGPTHTTWYVGKPLSFASSGLRALFHLQAKRDCMLGRTLFKQKTNGYLGAT